MKFEGLCAEELQGSTARVETEGWFVAVGKRKAKRREEREMQGSSSSGVGRDIG